MTAPPKDREALHTVLTHAVCPAIRASQERCAYPNCDCPGIFNTAQMILEAIESAGCSVVPNGVLSAARTLADLLYQTVPDDQGLSEFRHREAVRTVRAASPYRRAE